MPDPVLPQDDLLASTMTHPAPLPKVGLDLGPSWLEQAEAEHQKASEAFQQGGRRALLALDPSPTMDLAGMFGGEGALTADKEALATAQKMLSRGADRDAIWRATGWFQGADEKWRFEIPDKNSVFFRNQAAHLTGKISHPELFGAYPDLQGAKLSYDLPPRSGEYRKGPPEKISLSDYESFDLGDDKKVLLHEIMHAIQQREGFAKGGSPSSIKPIVKEALQAAGIPKPNKAEIDKYADEVYRRLAGEVESRNVGFRADKTPEWLKANPPWMTEDRPRGKQTVIGLTPVDHDPFVKNPKLTPVEHDPFK